MYKAQFFGTKSNIYFYNNLHEEIFNEFYLTEIIDWSVSHHTNKILHIIISHDFGRQRKTIN